MILTAGISTAKRAVQTLFASNSSVARKDITAMIIESILLNGKNKKANGYLKCALVEMIRALSYMSDAEFEIATTPENYCGLKNIGN